MTQVSIHWVHELIIRWILIDSWEIEICHVILCFACQKKSSSVIMSNWHHTVEWGVALWFAWDRCWWLEFSIIHNTVHLSDLCCVTLNLKTSQDFALEWILVPFCTLIYLIVHLWLVLSTDEGTSGSIQTKRRHSDRQDRDRSEEGAIPKRRVTEMVPITSAGM